MRPHRARSAKLFCSIEGTPFVSVSATLAAILLFIPMVVVEHHGTSSLDLAQVSHPIPMPDADSRDALVVAVMRNGWVFFGNHRITPEQMSPQVRERVTRGRETMVYMRVDSRAKYSDVAGVLDGLRSAGIRRVGFLLDQRKVPAPSRGSVGSTVYPLTTQQLEKYYV